MAITLELGTPGADQLQRDVHSKLVEMGYSQGGSDEDTALAEYIVINILSNKDIVEFTTELATDFLQTDPNNQALVMFVRGVFQHAEALSNGGNVPAGDAQPDSHAGAAPVQEDAEMDDSADAPADSAIPTGPKSMRNGGNARERRGGMRRDGDRSGDAALHGVRNGGGIGKMDGRGGRGGRGNTPRGPRGGLQKNMTPHQQQQLGAMAMSGGPMGMGMNGAMTPEQQLDMMRIHEAAQQLLQQSLMAGPFSFSQRGGGRFSKGFKNQRGGFNKQHGNHEAHMNGSDAMDLTSTNGDAEGASRQPMDPSQTVCRFNSDCTRADCPFAHRGPHSPLHTSIDLTTSCSFGANCTNRKCVSKHPSPASREVPMCTFFPNCTKPNCVFKHPDTPPCRNGADCTDEGCKFWHSQTACKYTPCTRQDCPFKHNEGQKQKAGSNVWINPELQAKDHVSERKFTDSTDQAEELILPNQQGGDLAVAGDVE